MRLFYKQNFFYSNLKLILKVRFDIRVVVKFHFFIPYFKNYFILFFVLFWDRKNKIMTTIDSKQSYAMRNIKYINYIAGRAISTRYFI